MSEKICKWQTVRKHEIGGKDFYGCCSPNSVHEDGKNCNWIATCKKANHTVCFDADIKIKCKYSIDGKCINNGFPSTDECTSNCFCEKNNDKRRNTEVTAEGYNPGYIIYNYPTYTDTCVTTGNIAYSNYTCKKCGYTENCIVEPNFCRQCGASYKVKSPIKIEKPNLIPVDKEEQALYDTLKGYGVQRNIILPSCDSCDNRSNDECRAYNNYIMSKDNLSNKKCSKYEREGLKRCPVCGFYFVGGKERQSYYSNITLFDGNTNCPICKKYKVKTTTTKTFSMKNFSHLLLAVILPLLIGTINIIFNPILELKLISLFAFIPAIIYSIFEDNKSIFNKHNNYEWVIENE